MQRVALGEGITPLIDREGLLPAAVGLASLHPPQGWVVELAVVLAARAVEGLQLLRCPRAAEHLGDAPVGVGILEATGSVLLDPYIAGDVAELIVVLIALAPCRADRGMLGIGPMQ